MAVQRDSQAIPSEKLKEVFECFRKNDYRILGTLIKHMKGEKEDASGEEE